MIYLDNAATTLEKPPAVSRAMCWAMRHAGGAGRSAHPPAMLGADIIYDTRRLAAQVFDVPDPTRVIFTANATQALNMALDAMAQTHRHFAISGFEHNAVYRPILELVKRNNLKLTMLRSALWEDALLLDLAYREDSRAQVDLNCVMNELGEIVEVQGTGEGRAFTLAEQQDLLRLCAKGCAELRQLQKEALDRR